MPKLLVVDDEPSILHFFRRAFPGPEVTLLTAQTAAEGLAAIERDRPDVVVLDINLGGDSGLETFRRARELAPKIPVIFITGHGTADTAIEAMRLGAYEYLLKPLELDHLTDLVDRAFEISRLMRVPATLPEGGEPSSAADALVGRAPAMQAVYKAVGRVAPQDVTVLILGESGTGKELIARAVYHYSKRANGPFLAINCAAIPENLLESELFGHEKGAFTGADRKRIGKFEQANGGTLFLDEIGDMTPLTQTKILRVLQGQEFQRVGGNESLRADVRVVAATNRDLEKMVADGTFRGDLYYRLNVFTVRLPPLRERGDDVPLLVEHFVRRFGRELDKGVRDVSPEAMDLLRRYPWPGNVRELQSVVKQALLGTTGPVILPEFLPPAVRRAADGGGPGLDFGGLTAYVEEQLGAGATTLYADYQAVTDRHLLGLVLRQTGGNLSQAARILGITRATLRTKLAALGLMVDRPAAGDEAGHPVPPEG
ncbi:sigma-54-dependent transcriptional regulator [Limnoglobus roseus]|uniref:DNA-binding transcriptional regulator NtrC n=1 Tax=Limnoglobus roseus TaxID=2598579 RepID=A0A5C1AFD0_9BACT|nr:sigma-54 dependent transcriptional regulator [Limnoglobus roseus]QEL17510.1 sigma-54-dependent Fis family transcriptional regulator [Limnoglobus roseus]